MQMTFSLILYLPKSVSSVGMYAVYICVWRVVSGRLKTHGYESFLEGVKGLKKRAAERPSEANRAVLASPGLRSRLSEVQV